MRVVRMNMLGEAVGGGNVARRMWNSAVGGNGDRIRRGLRCVSVSATSTGRKAKRSPSSSSSLSVDKAGGDEQQMERLSKVLQTAGVSSRRGADSLIEQGRVTVSPGGGKTRLPAADVQPFTRVCIARDIVCVDGEEIDIARSFDRLYDQKVYVALFKPKGYVCSVHSNSHKERMMRMRKASSTISSSSSSRSSFSSSPSAVAPTSASAATSQLTSSAKPVLELVSPLVHELSMWGVENGESQRLRDVRLFTVGRLDIATTGLLLITNDGQWCNRVMHPSSEIEREYCAVVESRPSRRQLAMLVAGTEVEGKHVAPIEVRCDEYVHRGGGVTSHEGIISTTTPPPTTTTSRRKNDRIRLYITVGEGRYHEIRKLIEAAGLNLRTLKRIRVGGLRLNSLRLREGEFKRLSRAEADMVFL